MCIKHAGPTLFFSTFFDNKLCLDHAKGKEQSQRNPAGLAPEQYYRPATVQYACMLHCSCPLATHARRDYTAAHVSCCDGHRTVPLMGVACCACTVSLV